MCAQVPFKHLRHGSGKVATRTKLTPLELLELSGIGDAKRLSEYNIPCLIDLPQVGENYQVRHLETSYDRYILIRIFKDHLGVMSAFGLTAEPTDEPDPSRTLAAFSFVPLKKIVPEEALAEMVDQLDSSFKAGSSTPLQKAQFALQRNTIDTNIGTAEILFVGAGGKTHSDSYLTIFAATQVRFVIRIDIFYCLSHFLRI